MLAEYSVILELETEGAAGLQIEAVSRGEIKRDMGGLVSRACPPNFKSSYCWLTPVKCLNKFLNVKAVASSCFQQGGGPSRGLLWDCETSRRFVRSSSGG